MIKTRSMAHGAWSPKVPGPFASTARRRQGFSLLEVVIGMTILAMISTTLFAVIRGSVKGAADIEQLQRENDQINRFLELCRLTFHTMPSSAQLTLVSATNSASGQAELGISGVPSCFGFGANPVSYEETFISLQPDPLVPNTEEGQPRYYLCISRKDIVPLGEDGNPINAPDSLSAAGIPSSADGQMRYWMPLLPRVILLQWRFFKDSTDEWLEEWNDSKWPDLIEMQLQMVGRSQPIRMVWAPPELQLRAPTRSATSSSSSSSSQNGGNNNNQGNGQNNNGNNGPGRGDGGGRGQGGGGRGDGGGGRGGPGGGGPGQGGPGPGGGRPGGGGGGGFPGGGGGGGAGPGGGGGGGGGGGR